MDDQLAGRRILVVEDSPVVAESSELILKDLGCEVVGPTGSMAVALQLAQEENLDAALVDLNIRGGKSFSVLQILEQRKIPFVLTSGYADWTMPEEWQDRPRLAKPYTEHMLLRGLLELIDKPSGTPDLGLSR